MLNCSILTILLFLTVCKYGLFDYAPRVLSYFTAIYNVKQKGYIKPKGVILVDSRKPRVEKQASRHHRDMVRAVLQRFRQTPQYLKILYKRKEDIEKYLTKAATKILRHYHDRMKSKIYSMFASPPPDGTITTKPEGTTTTAEAEPISDGGGLFKLSTYLKVTTTGDPDKTLDNDKASRRTLTPEQIRSFRIMGLQYAGQMVHALIKQMGPTEDAPKSTKMYKTSGPLNTKTTAHTDNPMANHDPVRVGEEQKSDRGSEEIHTVMKHKEETEDIPESIPLYESSATHIRAHTDEPMVSNDVMHAIEELNSDKGSYRSRPTEDDPVSTLVCESSGPHNEPMVEDIKSDMGSETHASIRDMGQTEDDPRSTVIYESSGPQTFAHTDTHMANNDVERVGEELKSDTGSEMITEDPSKPTIMYESSVPHTTAHPDKPLVSHFMVRVGKELKSVTGSPMINDFMSNMEPTEVITASTISSEWSGTLTNTLPDKVCSDKPRVGILPKIHKGSAMMHSFVKNMAPTEDASKSTTTHAWSGTLATARPYKHMRSLHSSWIFEGSLDVPRFGTLPKSGKGRNLFTYNIHTHNGHPPYAMSDHTFNLP